MPTLPMKPSGLNRPFEYLMVSTRKIAVPVPSAPYCANMCVDGPPNVSQPEAGKPTSVLATWQSGRAPFASFLIGPSTRMVAPNMTIAGASTDTCQRPFQPTVDVG